MLYLRTACKMIPVIMIGKASELHHNDRMECQYVDAIPELPEQTLIQSFMPALHLELPSAYGHVLDVWLSCKLKFFGCRMESCVGYWLVSLIHSNHHIKSVNEDKKWATVATVAFSELLPFIKWCCCLRLWAVLWYVLHKSLVELRNRIIGVEIV